MANNEEYLYHEMRTKQDRETGLKKNWEKPQLTVLDSKKTLGGPNLHTTYEDLTYHT